MPESSIDLTELPPLHDGFFATARLLMPRAKTPVNLRLDEDVIAWFRRQGRGYQSRINAVLRAYVDAEGRRRRAKSIRAGR